MGRVWAKKFELGRDPFLKKHVLTSLARKVPKNVCHSAIQGRFSFFPHHSPSRWSFWEQLEFFLCFFLSRFWLLASFFPWMGGRFCSAGDWVVFSSWFGSCWCISHSRFCLILLTHSKLGDICCYCPRFPGIVVNSFESHFGHDRAKNDSGIVSLFKL